MITRQEAESLRPELLGLLAEDAHDGPLLSEGLDRLGRDGGASPHAALLLLLTGLPFEASEACRHWQAIVERRRELGRSLGRDPGARVAVLDYFVHENRMLVEPRLIDLELVDAAETDPTRDERSGLASDRAFRTAVEREVRRARRYGERVALVLFDLDDFAAINRRVGATIGDRLLREAALLLSNGIRDIDLAARPGEDELAVVLPETDRHGATLVAERFRREVEAFFASREAAGQPVGLTISAGVAECPEDARDADALLRCAAQALYHAKAAGRNMVESYRGERRRFRRVDLAPRRVEIEVLGAEPPSRGRIRDASRGGILFVGPEAFDVGAALEVRLPAEAAARPADGLRGTVVRVDRLAAPLPVPGATLPDRFAIGLALGEPAPDGVEDGVDLFRGRREGAARG